MSRSTSLAARSGPALWPVLLLAVACAPPVQTSTAAGVVSPAAPVDARSLVGRMNGDWTGRFYQTLAFRQQNVTYTSAGEQRSEWFERQRVPGFLRIDFTSQAPPGSGLIYRGDSVYVFDAGRPAQSAPQPHPLLLLAADVYGRPVERTLADLARLRIDTTVFRRDTWEGRPVWVVGAAAGDTLANQFWIDDERMLLVRLIHGPPRTAQGNPPPTDYRISYQEVEGFAVPREIVFLRNGRPYFRETYVDARPNAPVDDAVFDPARWTEHVPPRP